MKYIKESEMCTKKKEQMKKEKDIVCKRALLQKEREIDWLKKCKKPVNCKKN